MIPISTQTKSGQGGQKNYQDSSSRAGLAEVGRYTGNVIQETIAPLEILSNILFLAAKSNDVEKIRDYLQEADAHLGTIGDINLNILRVYVKYAGASEMDEPLRKTG